jgi:hypothetical protein
MRFAPYVTRVDRIALAIGFRTSAAQDSAPAEPHGGALGSCSPVGSFAKSDKPLDAATAPIGVRGHR